MVKPKKDDIMGTQHRVDAEHIDYGFGTPVYLQNAPMVYVRESWCLNLNMSFLSEKVAQTILLSECYLTNGQIRNIQLNLEIPHQKFDEKFDTQVLKNFEEDIDGVPNLTWKQDYAIRLHAVEEFPEIKDEILKRTENSPKLSKTPERIAIDCSKLPKVTNPT